MYMQGRWAHCRNCTSKVPRVRLSAWLRHAGKTCDPLHRALLDDAPTPVGVPAHLAVQMGERVVHASHRSAAFRGLVWCWDCGAWGKKKLQKLADPCVAPTSRGMRDRAAFRRGQPPSGVCWPDTSAGLHVFPVIPPETGATQS